MISVEQLYHSYGQNDQYQVENVTFGIEDGEIFGFLGPNGAGKSTTQYIMTGLLPLQRGMVSIDGVDIRQSGREIFNRIGVSFEQPNVYRKLTGLENLRFFRGLFDVETLDPMVLLRRFGIEDAANRRAGTYSKGMQVRLMLARSLINNPRIWFLDEPTAGLDPASSQEVKQMILNKKAQGVTIFLTTHDMHVAEELCDRVAFIDNGQIVVMDTPRDLKLKYGEKVLKVEYRLNGKVVAERLSQSRERDRQRLYDLLEAGQVETIHSQEASLDSIFIALTGKELN